MLVTSYVTSLVSSQCKGVCRCANGMPQPQPKHPSKALFVPFHRNSCFLHRGAKHYSRLFFRADMGETLFATIFFRAGYTSLLYQDLSNELFLSFSPPHPWLLCPVTRSSSLCVPTHTSLALLPHRDRACPRGSYDTTPPMTPYDPPDPLWPP